MVTLGFINTLYCMFSILPAAAQQISLKLSGLKEHTPIISVSVCQKSERSWEMPLPVSCSQAVITGALCCGLIWRLGRGRAGFQLTCEVVAGFSSSGDVGLSVLCWNSVLCWLLARSSLSSFSPGLVHREVDRMAAGLPQSEWAQEGGRGRSQHLSCTCLGLPSLLLLSSLRFWTTYYLRLHEKQFIHKFLPVL